MLANFCLQCGHALAWRSIDGTDRQACPSCSFVFWGDYSIGVGALVRKEDKILLVRRCQEPGRGVWTNPGGYCEQNEPLDETIVREVHEETNVTAQIESVVALRDLPGKIHNVYIAFSMRYSGGEPVPDGLEVDKAGFYSLQEMESMKVAGLTRWLVDIAYHGSLDGLQRELSSSFVSTDNHLFRTRADLGEESR